jgi:hypothetical protein
MSSIGSAIIRSILLAHVEVLPQHLLWVVRLFLVGLLIEYYFLSVSGHILGHIL